MRASRNVIVGAILMVVALIAVLALPVRQWLEDFIRMIEGFGIWGPILFTFAYIIAAVFLIPGSVLTLGAGAVWGLAKATVIVSIAATMAATAAFLVGRHLAREWVRKKIASNPKFEAIDRAVAREGWRIVVLTRLSPVFPYVILNYAFGLTGIRLRDYVIATYFGMLPGAVLYVLLGSLARAGTRGDQTSPAQWAIYGLGLAATIAVTVLITRLAKRALAERIG